MNFVSGYIYDDFSVNILDTKKWQEIPGSDLNNLFVDEHFVDYSKNVYHTAQLNPADRGVTIQITNHTFVSGEVLEYDINYLSGSGNRISVIDLDSKTKHIGVIGYWNKIEPGGNDFGLYHVIVEFGNNEANITITKPDDSISKMRFGSIGNAHSIGIGTRTGHDGVVSINYDNFKIYEHDNFAHPLDITSKEITAQTIKNTGSNTIENKKSDGITDFLSGLVIILLFIFLYKSITKKIKYEKEKKILEEEKRERKIFEEEQKKIQEQVEGERKIEEEQKKMGLIKYIDNMGNEKWDTEKQIKKWKEIDIGLSNNFAHLSPYQFEEFVSELFQKMGYKTKVTKKSGDFGADVIAEKENERIVIQVKKYAKGNNVNPEEIQRTLGAMWKFKADKAIFVTTSDFTVRAKEVQKEAPIELWNNKILQEMVRKYFIQ